MKLSFDLRKSGGILTVQRERDDPKAKASGFTKDVHGWGAEIHLLYLIQQKLQSIGLQLSRVKVWKDGHMYGDDHMCYLRTPKRLIHKMPHIFIYDGNYQIRSSATEYNSRQEVKFIVDGDVLNKQPDWGERVARLCEVTDVNCKIRFEYIIRNSEGAEHHRVQSERKDAGYALAVSATQQGMGVTYDKLKKTGWTAELATDGS